MQEEKLHNMENDSEEVVDQSKEKEATEKEHVENQAVNGSEKQETEELSAQLAAKQEEYDILFNRYQRLQADFENFKRRSRKELDDMAKFGIERLMVALLPFLDNFARALEGAPKDGEVGKYMAGMEMIYRQCLDILKGEGLKEIEAVGQPFDPEKHHAVMQVETEKAEEDNIVKEELQVGYTLNDKVIRPSMVKVAKYAG